MKKKINIIVYTDAEDIWGQLGLKYKDVEKEVHKLLRDGDPKDIWKMKIPDNLKIAMAIYISYMEGALDVVDIVRDGIDHILDNILGKMFGLQKEKAHPKHT